MLRTGTVFPETAIPGDPTHVLPGRNLYGGAQGQSTGKPPWPGAAGFTARSVREGCHNTVAETQKTGLKGFEPLTCGLRVRRYAELSYRPKPVRPNNVVDDAE